MKQQRFAQALYASMMPVGLEGTLVAPPVLYGDATRPEFSAPQAIMLPNTLMLDDEVWDECGCAGPVKCQKHLVMGVLAHEVGHMVMYAWQNREDAEATYHHYLNYATSTTTERNLATCFADALNEGRINTVVLPQRGAGMMPYHQAVVYQLYVPSPSELGLAAQLVAALVEGGLTDAMLAELPTFPRVAQFLAKALRADVGLFDATMDEEKLANNALQLMAIWNECKGTPPPPEDHCGDPECAWCDDLPDPELTAGDVPGEEEIQVLLDELATHQDRQIAEGKGAVFMPPDLPTQTQEGGAGGAGRSVSYDALVEDATEGEPSDGIQVGDGAASEKAQIVR